MMDRETSQGDNVVATISAPEVVSVEVKDNGERLVPIQFSNRLVLPSAMHTHVEGNPDSATPFLRSQVMQKLLQVVDHVDAQFGLGLVLIEAYRSFDEQMKLFEKAGETAGIMVSDPRVYSPHVTGGAVDVGLFDPKSGDYLPVGNMFAYDESAKTAAKGLTPEDQGNRAILLEAMAQAGFVNYPLEWWHYSFGDKYWGYTTGSPAIYDSVKLPT